MENKLKETRKTVFVIFLALMLAVQGKSYVHAAEDLSGEIRVGLTSLYSDRAEIKINNNIIQAGYCVGNVYYEEVTLKSSNGFRFTCTDAYYYVTVSTYRDFATADKVAGMLKKSGVNAYPALVYHNKWKVYVGGKKTEDEMSGVLEMVHEKYSINFEDLSGDNGYRFMAEGSDNQIIIDIDRHGAYPQFRENGKIMDLGTRLYRGRIEIGRFGKNTLTAINVVNIEEYLYGVVPCEMPFSWHEEALKVQAVCARSYAVVKAGYKNSSNIKNAYSLVDTTASQVYKGYLSETDKTNYIVDVTKGQVVSYNNKVIATYYSSTSGGRTESSEEAWGIKTEYLISVPDVYEMQPEKKEWLFSFTKEQIKKALSDKGINIGDILSLYVLDTSESYRVNSVRLNGTEKNRILQGSVLKDALELFSTKYKIVSYGENPDRVSAISKDGIKEVDIGCSYVISGSGNKEVISMELSQYIVIGAGNRMNYVADAPDSKDTFIIAGLGYGHGVGMSQSGAKGMAEAGFTYKEIIQYYFNGAVVR